MRRTLLLLTLFFAALSPGWAHADVVVLVHGYLGDALSWERSGVNATLAANGWQRAGIVVPGFQGPVLPPPFAGGGNKAYAVELPSTAPLAIQSDILIRTLRAIEARHAGEPITIVGHSAGGVVARMALVRGGVGRVTRLITIASPNLGTERALEALDETHTGGPVGVIKDVLGGHTYRVVKHSWPVLLDLAPAVPGSTLHWLNVQHHPDIQYVSIVRGAAFGLGDELVPGFSQDLNNVPPLRGKARAYAVPAEHGLVPGDGTLLAQILAGR
jgi:pimeloyl-ACP methyl ester carboxylesterase